MKPLKALIVEDDPVSQHLLATVTRNQGFEVTICANGAEGLYYFLKETDYSLVLLDLMMPEVDGEQFLHVVEALHNANLLTGPGNVVVQTAIGNYAYLQRILNFKCVFSVRTKPLHKAELEMDIKRMLERSN